MLRHSSELLNASSSKVASVTAGPRQRNRIIMICTALFDKDTPQWPFWKFQHLKNTRGVTDFVMLAVTRQDSFVAAIQNGVASTRNLKRGMKTLDPKLLSSFLDQWYQPNSYFVYGGHGCSDLLEFDDDHRMQVHELADIIGPRRKFLGMLFDACVMASLDAAYYLRNNTGFIGASEGWMWEEDTWGENHMFNPYSAALMCRDSNPKRVLQLIGEEYTRKSRLADFSVIDTSKAEQLWNLVHTRHMGDIHSSVTLKPEVRSGAAPVTLTTYEDSVAEKYSSSPAARLPATYVVPAVTAKGVAVARTHEYRTNFEFKHALYPSQWDEDHILDLGSFLKRDKEATALLKNVVAWRAGPSDTGLYAVPALSGLNVALGQYSYQSSPRLVSIKPPLHTEAPKDEGVALQQLQGKTAKSPLPTTPKGASNASSSPRVAVESADPQSSTRPATSPPAVVVPQTSPRRGVVAAALDVTLPSGGGGGRSSQPSSAGVVTKAAPKRGQLTAVTTDA